ncbi:MAG: gliding motility-associated C-terminal domain-containing protein [Bacteroidia bacterium]|jgi:gliding motility-associated-like protein
MGEKEHIDELLKESFKQFEPASPDVWSNISQQLGHQAVQAGAAAKINAAIKSATLTTKVFIAVGIPALGLTGYALYTYTTEKTNESVVLIDTPPGAPELQVQVAPEVEMENQVTQSVTSEKAIPESKHNKVQPVSKPTHDKGYTTPDEASPVQVQADESLIPSTEIAPAMVKPAPSRIAPKTNVKSSTRERMNRQANTQVKEHTPVKLDAATGVDDVVIYNAITPDGDGKNDFFKVQISEVSRFFLAIKDSDGNTVFEAESKDKAWDGKHQRSGEDCKSGTYIYFLVYDLPDGKSHTKSGPILLIR